MGTPLFKTFLIFYFLYIGIGFFTYRGMWWSKVLKDIGFGVFKSWSYMF